MVETKIYHLPPTALMPNSPLPLIHYTGVLKESERTSGHAFDLFWDNGWRVQWLVRYPHTQRAHYHGASHECMAVLTGTATIRFGVADTAEDLEENTHGSAYEEGGIELQANAGDVFIIPAGVSHKTYNTLPAAEFERLSGGDGHDVDIETARELYHSIKLSGFTMLGAYPKGCQWDFLEGGEHEGNYEKVWSVPKPDTDPVFGTGKRGIMNLWGKTEIVPRL
ncbi:hypothetical protein BU24DRAFT_421973 [Aaosphaeria arxii CBS 175.79]|uniref:Cupin type-1 domain-containing protein n=1 Tax=Aaosphaeria arxii CBS 175.79 TaxID=1450172 RepID=A0A6A5XSJ5_9PLEO|nr:uncharacterized protein BU24DRAFT_421973 [Aaosphaeria arxii CBS 175.79]KAF2015670.1 hypothetical protein BU24DRAFT_421973 [Aaosphaeria arxii CBS 175.79]